MLARRSHALRMSLAIAAIALFALSAGASSASALTATPPVLKPVRVTDSFVEYQVTISAQTDAIYTRWEAKLYMGWNGSEPGPAIHYWDYSIDRESQYTWDKGRVTLFRGDTYVLYAWWNPYSGDGRQETGQSPPITVQVPPREQRGSCHGAEGCVDESTPPPPPPPPAPAEEDDSDGLKAHAGGPYRVKRGGRVKLNGAKSKGRIKSYKWTFRPAPAEPGAPTVPVTPPLKADGHAAESGGPAESDRPPACTPRARAKKTGKTTKVVVVCEMEAVLTVKDRKGRTDTDTEKVEVQARKFPGIPVSTRNKVKKLYPALKVTSSGRCVDDCYFGRNVAPGDAERTGQHNSRFIEGGRDDVQGYDVDEVDDPDGPYDGHWYVASHELKIDRTLLVNAELHSDSKSYKGSLAENRQRAKLGLPLYNPAEVYASVVAHETVHTTLMKEKLAELRKGAEDPVKQLEELVLDTRYRLEKNANGVIGDADQKVADHSLDEGLVRSRLEPAWGSKEGRMLLPTDGRGPVEWYAASLANKG